MDEYDRHHLHRVDGVDVWCETLTHCPSVCDCPVDECTATVSMRAWGQA